MSLLGGDDPSERLTAEQAAGLEEAAVMREELHRNPTRPRSQGLLDAMQERYGRAYPDPAPVATVGPGPAPDPTAAQVAAAASASLQWPAAPAGESWDPDVQAAADVTLRTYNVPVAEAQERLAELPGVLRATTGVHPATLAAAAEIVLTERWGEAGKERQISDANQMLKYGDAKLTGPFKRSALSNTAWGVEFLAWLWAYHPGAGGPRRSGSIL